MAKDEVTSEERYIRAALADGSLVAVGASAVQELIDEIDRLRALSPGSTGETEGWWELMRELADDLAAELEARYPEESRNYPSQAMKFYADMEPVRRASAMLAAAGGKTG